MFTMVLGQMMNGYNDDYWHNGPSGWGIAIMVVGGVLIIALVIAVIVLVTRSGRPNSAAAHSSTSPTARDILDRRYAAGEIDTAEYDERKRSLG